jgi:signal transduction histidine kinase
LESVRKTNENLLTHIDERVQIETQLRKSQLLYQTVASNFPDGIIGIVNKQFKYVFVEGRELAGSDLNVRTSNKVHEIVLSQYKTELGRAFDGDNVTFEVEFGEKYYDVVATPLMENYQSVSEVLMVIRNITRYKTYEQGLQQALEKEKQLNALKTRFVSNVSHEFRTPLTTILSSVFLIDSYAAKGGSTQFKSHTDRIKRSVKNLTELLEDFLSLEKLSEGKVTVNTSTFPLSKFVEEFSAEAEMIKKKEQSILFRVNEDINISTDRTILSNILNNLVSNAVKYSEEGTEIRVDMQVFDERLHIAVEDHGMGIPESEQAHIFERFYRACNASNVQGTGLGLNLVKKYVELLKGQISFMSTVGVGSRFSISIPMQTEEKLVVTASV